MGQRTLAFRIPFRTPSRVRSRLSFRAYAFRPPAWRSPAALHVQTGVLFLGSLIWLAIYGGLALRLWDVGVAGAGMVEAVWGLLAVVSGVPVAVSWWRILRRWRAGRRGAWPALSLEQVRALTPGDFEAYVAQRIFARQGYSVENTPDVKDGGVDILVADAHGRRAVVQCKRYRGTVGEAVVRDLYGTMIHNDALMAYLVTTGSISEAARRWAAGKPIGLIDGPRLVELSHAEPAQP